MLVGILAIIMGAMTRKIWPKGLIALAALAAVSTVFGLETASNNRQMLGESMDMSLPVALQAYAMSLLTLGTLFMISFGIATLIRKSRASKG